MTNTEIDILERAVTSRQEARPLIQTAVRHFREARRATIQVMADLRTLQNGEVQVLYGYKNFAQWAEDTFEGLRAGNVRQLTRAGAIALELHDRGLIDLRKPEGIGTTGLRELSVISKEHGVEKMIEVFLTARGMLDEGREISDTTVKAAIRVLMPPANEKVISASTEIAVAAADEEELEGYSPEVRELIERIRDLSWDLPESAGELQDETERLREMMGQ